MTNYGLSENDTPRSVDDFEREAFPTRAQMKARHVIDFINTPSSQRVALSRHWKREREFSANWARINHVNPWAVNDNDFFRFGWGPRPTGRTDEFVPSKPRWLMHELRQPLWLRIWWKIRYPHGQLYKTRFKDWDRDDRNCNNCNAVLPRDGSDCPCRRPGPPLGWITR